MANDLKLRVLLNVVDKALGPLKRITEGSTSTARTLKAAREQFKALNAQQRDISGYRQQHEAVRKTSERLAQAQQKLRGMRQDLQDMAAPTAQFQRQFLQASESVKKLSATHGQQREELRKLISRMREAGTDTRNLATHEQRLAERMRNTSAQIDAQTEKLRRQAGYEERLSRARSNYHRGMQSTGALAATGMAGRATGVYTGEKLQQMLGVGYEFDATMSATQAVTRIERKDDPQMLKLREQARTLPLSSKFTDKEVAQGQFYLGRTGYNAQQILGAMPGMLNLAAAGNMELGETADIASNIQTAMGIPAEKMDKVADVLTAAFTRNNVDIRMLGESLKYSAGVGREYGQSLETVTTATALLGNAGVQGSMAGTAMRSILTRLGTSKTVSKLGVQTKDENGNMRDMLDILKDISAKTAGMGNVQRGALYKDIAGQYAVTSFGTLMRSVEGGQFQTMRESVNGSEGEALRVAQTQLDNLKGDMTILHAGLENISVELFEKNNAWLRAMASDLSQVLHKVAEFLKANPAVSRAIVITMGAFALLAGTLGSVAIAVAGVLGPMIAMRFMLASIGLRLPSLLGLLGKLPQAFTLLGGSRLAGGLGSGLSVLLNLARTAALTVLPLLSGAIGTLGAAIMATPIGWILAALAGLIGAGLLVYKYWAPIKGFFLGFWQGLTAAMQPALVAFGQLWAALKSLGAAIMEVPLLGDLLRLAWQVAGPLIQLIGTGIGKLITWCKGLLKPVDDIGGAAQHMGERFGQAIGGMLAQLMALPTKFIQLGAQIAQGLADGIRSGIGFAKDAINQLGDSTISWFKEKLGIHSPSRVFAQLGGFTSAGLAQGITAGQGGPLAAITALAQRVIAAAGIALPLLTGGGLPTVQAAERPLPRIDTRAPIGASAGNTINIEGDSITFHITAGPGTDANELRRLLNQLLDERERNKAARVRSRLSDTE